MTTAWTRSSAAHFFIVFDHLGYLRLEVMKFTMFVPVNVDTYTVTQDIEHDAFCCSPCGLAQMLLVMFVAVSLACMPSRPLHQLKWDM